LTPAAIAAIEASLLRVTFLGKAVRVAPKLAEILAKVDRHLGVAYTRAMLAQPGGVAIPTFEGWCGVTSVGGYRVDAGWHGKGLAIDINYARNGYSACRTVSPLGRIVYGGEAAGAGLRGVREAFCDACDRACHYVDGQDADLSARKKGETDGDVWDRWHWVSEAVVAYFAPYYPVRDDYDAGDDDTLGVPIPPQVAADYRALRVVLVVGQPLPHPRLTRNPAKGLINITRPVFVALGAEGLRMGLCDLSARESGDAMHFDCGARIVSGA